MRQSCLCQCGMLQHRPFPAGALGEVGIAVAQVEQRQDLALDQRLRQPARRVEPRLGVEQRLQFRFVQPVARRPGVEVRLAQQPQVSPQPGKLGAPGAMFDFARIAAGPGNPPVVVDETCDIDKAGADVVTGASLDNNVICTDEKTTIVVDSVADRLVQAIDGHGSMNGVAVLQRGG